MSIWQLDPILCLFLSAEAHILSFQTIIYSYHKQNFHPSDILFSPSILQRLRDINMSFEYMDYFDDATELEINILSDHRCWFCYTPIYPRACFVVSPHDPAVCTIPSHSNPRPLLYSLANIITRSTSAFFAASSLHYSDTEPSDLKKMA